MPRIWGLGTSVGAFHRAIVEPTAKIGVMSRWRTADAPDGIPSGMPVDLAAAINRFDDGNREIALANWELIGPDGRQLLIYYLDAVYIRWFRRGRCKLAAQQLLTPDTPMPLGNYGSAGT